MWYNCSSYNTYIRDTLNTKYIEIEDWFDFYFKKPKWYIYNSYLKQKIVSRLRAKLDKNFNRYKQTE
jgi:hypothetical protein